MCTCGSRKYPYLPKGWFFGLDIPIPQEFSVQLHTFLLKFWLLRHPSPSEFPMTILGRGGGYGYFLEPHNLQYKELFLASLTILKRKTITKRKQYTLQYTLCVIFTCTLCVRDQT